MITLGRLEEAKAKLDGEKVERAVIFLNRQALPPDLRGSQFILGMFVVHDERMDLDSFQVIPSRPSLPMDKPEAIS